MSDRLEKAVGRLKCKFGFHWYVQVDSETCGMMKRGIDECERCGKRKDFYYFLREGDDYVWPSWPNPLEALNDNR